MPRQMSAGTPNGDRSKSETARKQAAATLARMPTARARHYKSLLARPCGQHLFADELIQGAVDAVARAMGTEVATLYAYDSRAEQLVLVATHGLNRSSVGYVTLLPGQGMSGEAFLSGQPVVAADVRELTGFFRIRAFDQGRYLSLLAVPVPLGAESGSPIIGALNVQTIDVRQYQARDVQELCEVAEQLGPVLDAVWKGDLAARIRGPAALSRMDGLLAGHFSPPEIAERLAEQLQVVFPVRRSTVAVFGADGSPAMYGDQPDEHATAVLERAIGEEPASFDPQIDESSGILVPLNSGSRLVGAFYVALGAGTPGPVSSAAMRLLDSLAGQVSSALLQAPEAGRSDSFADLAGDMKASTSGSAYEELIQSVLDGAGLDSLLARGGELCRGVLAVTDRLGTLVAGTMPVSVGVNVPLTVEGVVLGRLVAASPAKPSALLTAVIQAAALELSKWKVRFDVEQELRGDALDSLLSAPDDARETATRARLIGIDTARRYVPVLFAFDAEALAEKRGSLVLRSMLATIQRGFGPAPASVSFARAEGVLVLVDEAALPRGPRPAVAAALADLRLTATGTAVSAGIGPGAEAADFGEAIREARLAADLAIRLEASAPIDAAQLGTYRLLLGIDDRRRLQEFVDQYLGVLLEHDSRQGTQFVRTLEAFHAHSDNPRLAAAALFVHVNTLKYRLSRIEALTGFDLHRISDRFNMYIALYALRFLEPDRHSLLPSDFHLPPVLA